MGQLLCFDLLGGGCPQTTDGHVHSSCQRNGISC